MGTTKPPEIRFVGPREGFQKCPQSRFQGGRGQYLFLAKFDLFDHGSYTSCGPTDLSPSSFVVPMGTTKPPEIGFVGHLEVSLKKFSAPGGKPRQGPRRGLSGTPEGGCRTGRYGRSAAWGGTGATFYDCFGSFEHILTDFEIFRFL